MILQPHFRTRDARMIEFEPGDATRYTAFWSFVHMGPIDPEDYIYIAIGAGEIVSAGYYLPVDQLIAMAKGLMEAESPIKHIRDSGLPDYYRSHIPNGMNPWTSVVAVLLAVVVVFESRNLREQLDLIGHVYRGDVDGVRNSLHSIFNE